jgi:N-acetylglucosamine-6-phosphate deacetylase
MSGWPSTHLPYSPLLIANARLVAPHRVVERGWLACEDGAIRALGPGDPPEMAGFARLDAGGRLVMPGFIDLHVHGAMGAEVMDAVPDALATMARYFARHGVTSFLATTWTNSRERIQAALEAVASYMAGPPVTDGAQVLGVHLEGPYLNPAMCGAQDSGYIRRAAPAEALAFLETGVIRQLSLAPEYPENHWLIAECARRGITVSAAHTASTYEQMEAAFVLGLGHATHTFNAMTGLHHRAPGALGAALNAPDIGCELIADNIHVHLGAMRLLWRVKGDDGVNLITDAVKPAGLPDGQYDLNGRSVTVARGEVRLPDGTLSGSTLTLDRALVNFSRATGEPLERLWKAVSLNAARAIRVDDRKGSLAVGKDADLALLDPDGSVQLTVVGGRIVHTGPQITLTPTPSNADHEGESS